MVSPGQQSAIQGGPTWLHRLTSKRPAQTQCCDRSRSRPPRRTSRTCARALRPPAGPRRRRVDDQSQGVQLATMQALARYWETEYDWRKCEARLNAVPNFITEIDGLDIHFVHVRSKHEDALPLIVTHGWPGSVIEQLKIVDLLTDPTAHGASASDAFHVVIPSMPGYGFSGRPTATGWDPAHIGARLGGADEAPRLRAVRGAGRRLGRGRHRSHGRAAPPRACSASTQPAWAVPPTGPLFQPRPRQRSDRRRAAVRSVSRRSDAQSSSSGSSTSTRRTPCSWRRARRR